MVGRIILMLIATAALAACNRLSHQASVHVQLADDTKTISDIAEGLADKLRLNANKADFDYGGVRGRQTVYKLTNLSSIVFVSTESAAYCARQPDPDHITFDDRLLVVNLAASTSDKLAASLAALRQVSAANGASVRTKVEEICPPR